MGNFFSHLTAATTANCGQILLGCGNGVGLDVCGPNRLGAALGYLSNKYMKIGVGYRHHKVL